MGHVTGLLKENGKGAGFRTEPFFSSLLEMFSPPYTPA